MKNLMIMFLVLATVLGVSVPSLSEAANTDLDRRIWEAKKVLEEIMMAPDDSIPEELLAKCKAIAIYPNVLKGGFIFGARYGKGVVLKRDEATGKWGPLAFSTIGGGSWGLQIGGQATDLILVVMSERGLQGLLSNNFTLGAGAEVAAGPVGRHSEAATDLSLRAGILSYSRSRGLFAGISLGGAVLTQDNNSNSSYYGKYLTSKDILLNNAVSIQPSSKELTNALNEYSSLWAQRKHYR
jgi:lipid-binding SYLF domain-containing protein